MRGGPFVEAPLLLFYFIEKLNNKAILLIIKELKTDIKHKIMEELPQAVKSK